MGSVGAIVCVVLESSSICVVSEHFPSESVIVGTCPFLKEKKTVGKSTTKKCGKGGEIQSLTHKKNKFRDEVFHFM